jgi:hypothetical protein
MKTTRRHFFATAAAGGAAALSGCASTGVRIRDAGGPEIVVPERKVSVLAEADVVVCGGGSAGIAAAYSAARNGAKVILLERWPSLGGMGTNALVNIWHVSDRKKQVIFGVVQEAIDRADSFMERFADFPKRPETHQFDPEGMRVVYGKMLRDAGVRVICNLVAVESVVEDGRIRAVLVDTKEGRLAVRGKIFIDATGDGDVAANAGAKFDLGREEDGRVQGMTMMFRLRGVDRSRAMENRADADRVFAKMKSMRDAGKFPNFLEMAAQSYLRSPRAPGISYNMVPAAGNPLNAEELTRLSLEAREHVYQIVELWQHEMPGFENAEVEHMGFSIGVRETRRVRGLKTLTAQNVVKAEKQPDAIGHGFWMIDIHDPKGTGHTTWVDQKADAMPPAGDSYHIPLGICLNPSIANLACAGRCISATHEALASVRLQTHCMVMGQGVGTCAALALDGGTTMANVDSRALQATLRKNGAYIENVPQLQ